MNTFHKNEKKTIDLTGRLFRGQVALEGITACVEDVCLSVCPQSYRFIHSRGKRSVD